MNHKKVNSALAPIGAERSSLMYNMNAYESATSDENRDLAVKAILNNLKTIDELGDKFRAVVFESRTTEELEARIHTISPMEANARLIAAAPDLLEALKELIGQVQGFQECNGDKGFVLSDAITAIVKATGEQQ